MNPQIQRELEQLCDAPLPIDYLELLKSYPSTLASARRADDGSDSEGCVADVEFLARSEEILEINQEVRHGSILDPEGQEFRWPDQLLVIGETGDGDYYCVDTDGEHDGVLQFLHYAVEFESIADSLNDFVEMLLEAYVLHIASDIDSDESAPEEIE